MIVSTLRKVFSGAWWFVSRVSHVVISMVVFVLFAFVVASLFKGGPKIEDKSALVIDLKGALVEQAAGNARSRLMGELSGDETEQTQLRDFVAVLDAAAKDSKIDRVVLILDDFTGGGLSLLREAAFAIERFKTSGKQVVAWGSAYDQRQYYLAAHANEVFVHPMGGVILEGFGRYRNFYKDAFDKLGVKAHVMRVGTYKSFAEPYMLNAPSKASLEAESFLYNDLWATYTNAVEKARKLPAGAINKGIEELPAKFEEAKGDFGKYTLSTKMVDALKTRDEFRAMMIERGAKDEEKKTFRQVNFSTYLSTIKPKRSGDAVAVVVAEGNIVDGTAAAGSVGGLSTSALIRKARENDDVKAVVLRVNSPGGSAFASELIRRELELTRKAGKPVVVSMGNLAASGGYWISMSADEVIADPATITGSIGVFAILPTAEEAMKKLYVNTDGVTTTWLGGAYDVRRGLDPRMQRLVQASVGNIYTEFTTKAAAARKTTPEKIDEVGQGRVWTGNQAKERGLVDRVGSFSDALKSATSKAKLGDDARVLYMEPEPSKLQKILSLFGASALEQWARATVREVASEAAAEAGRAIPAARVASLAKGPLAGAAREAERDLVWLSNAAAPASAGAALTAHVHCLCRAE